MFCARDDQAQTLTWDSHGFELHLPVNTCLPGEKCEIMVDAVVGGEFVFPEGVEPVSAIYIISITSKLRKPSLLKIQHCVALDKVSKHNDLSFYRALLKEPKPPYHFKRVKGGKFNDQFGELELPAFCAIAIGKGSSSCSGDEAGSDTQSVESNDTSSGFSENDREHSVFDRDKSQSGAKHSGRPFIHTAYSLICIYFFFMPSVFCVFQRQCCEHFISVLYPQTVVFIDNNKITCICAEPFTFND